MARPDTVRPVLASVSVLEAPVVTVPVSRRRDQAVRPVGGLRVAGHRERVRTPPPPT